MKNLKPYNYSDNSLANNSYEFIERIFRAKHDANLKAYFENNQIAIKLLHDLYDIKFYSNMLFEINESNASVFTKDNFEKLYSYTNSKIKKLRIAIQNLQENSIKHKCQYCTINNHSTFDHILPKSNFWEYIVHPLNLIPCCPECNSKLSNKEYASLNLYLDMLPPKQYLFVRITFINSTPDFNFYLQNINQIASGLYKKIENHFNNLALLTRVNEAAITEFTEFFNLIKYQLSISSWDNIMEAINKSILENKQSYGYNHWKFILQETLINDVNFKSACLAG